MAYLGDTVIGHYNAVKVCLWLSWFGTLLQVINSIMGVVYLNMASFVLPNGPIDCSFLGSAVVYRWYNYAFGCNTHASSQTLK